MKTTLLLLIGLLSAPAFATVDAFTTVYLVTWDYNSEEFDVVGYQYSGCYGVEEGPQSAVFTEPFLIKAPRGCGMSMNEEEDVNALSCASAEYEWNDDDSIVRKVTLDVSQCPEEFKSSDEFTVMAKKAARKNFKSLRDIVIKK